MPQVAIARDVVQEAWVYVIGCWVCSPQDTPLTLPRKPDS
jgi:hypothetical protein